jgi:rhodanese-related sulfurtransferase
MKIIYFFLIAIFLAACTKPQEVAKNADPLSDIKQTVRTKFPTVTQLSTNDYAAWMKDPNRKKPLLLDARNPEEFTVSHLRYALNVADEPQIVEVLKGYPKDSPIVAYCSVGYRSSMLVEKLKSQGYTNVVNLEGSIFQWANEGRPVFQNEQPVTQVHQYDKKWGELLKPELRAPLN